MRNWYIVHRTDKRLSPVARAFKEFRFGETASLPRGGPGARWRARR